VATVQNARRPYRCCVALDRLVQSTPHPAHLCPAATTLARPDHARPCSTLTTTPPATTMAFVTATPLASSPFAGRAVTSTCAASAPTVVVARLGLGTGQTNSALDKLAGEKNIVERFILPSAASTAGFSADMESLIQGIYRQVRAARTPSSAATHFYARTSSAPSRHFHSCLSREARGRYICAWSV
jgi:hypothetical protein